MKKLHLKGTDDTPEILLDKEGNQFEVSGKSLPEDASAFYSPVIDWMKEYSENANDETVLKINLEYFNSTSAKYVFNIFMLLETISESGKEVRIDWVFKDGDELMESKGEEIKSMIEIPMEIICQ